VGTVVEHFGHVICEGNTHCAFHLAEKLTTKLGSAKQTPLSVGLRFCEGVSKLLHLLMVERNSNSATDGDGTDKSAEQWIFAYQKLIGLFHTHWGHLFFIFLHVL
jgi:hypothetical protein